MKLFKVTIPWERNDVEQGDFCENTWAKDDDEAIRNVATSMAHSYFEDDEEEPDDKDFNEKIDEYVDNAGLYAAVDVAYAIVSDIRDLLAGPGGQLTPQAEVVYDGVLKILKLKG